MWCLWLRNCLAYVACSCDRLTSSVCGCNGRRWACLCCGTHWGWAKQLDGRTAELAAALHPYGARGPELIQSRAASCGSTPSPRLERLVTGCRLPIPSLHPIGEKDASRKLSEDLATLYAETLDDTHGPASAASGLSAPSSTTTGSLPEDASQDASASLPLRTILVHPNDHMPPRQKEFAQALASLARRHSPSCV